MSTFAVFGMAPQRALEIAHNGIKPTNTESAPEWEARCLAESEKIMDSDRTIQLSEKFDAPHFADQFLEIAKRDGARRLHIKAHCWNGDLDPKTKKKVLRWFELGSDAYKAVQEKMRHASVF